MRVGADLAAADISKQRHRKSVAHGVDEDVGLERQQSLQAENHWAEALPEQRETGIPTGFNPASLPQKHKIDSRFVDRNVENIFGFFDDFCGRGVCVAGVNRNVDLIFVSKRITLLSVIYSICIRAGGLTHSEVLGRRTTALVHRRRRRCNTGGK